MLTREEIVYGLIMTIVFGTSFYFLFRVVRDIDKNIAQETGIEEDIDNHSSNEITATTLVSDRLKSCEEKGGRYTLRYSDFYEKYIEDCFIKAREIEEF